MKNRKVFTAGGTKSNNPSMCITIPSPICYAMGIVPGTEIVTECKDGKIILIPKKETLKPYFK